VVEALVVFGRLGRLDLEEVLLDLHVCLLALVGLRSKVNQINYTIF
jgi:hypothetical protein